MKPVYEYDTIKEAIGYCTEGEWVKKSNPKLDALLQDDMFRDYIWASIRCMHAKNEMADIEKQHLDAVSRYKGYLEEENRCRKRIQVSLFPENFFEQLLGGGRKNENH